MEPLDTTFRIQDSTVSKFESAIMHVKKRMTRIAVFVLLYMVLMFLILPISIVTVVPAYLACYFFFKQVVYYFCFRRQTKLVRLENDELVFINIANSTRTISGTIIDSIVISERHEQPFGALTPHLELKDKHGRALVALSSNYFDIAAIMAVLSAWAAKVTSRPLRSVLDVVPAQIRKTNSTLYKLKVVGKILIILGLFGTTYFVHSYAQKFSLAHNGILVEGTVVGHEVSNDQYYLYYRFTDISGTIYYRSVWTNNALWSRYHHNGPIMIRYAAENPGFNCFVGEAIEKGDVLLIALCFLVALMGVGFYFIGRVGPTSTD